MNQSKTGQPLEIERKFLIKRPDENELAAVAGAYKYEMEQIYLTVTDGGEHARIRRRESEGKVECFYTVKRKISELTRVEIEREISPEEYSALATGEGERPAIIKKTRWCIPAGKHTAEVDIYPFWSRTATAEVELEAEDEEYTLPSCLCVIREVTGQRQFLNRSMALQMQKDGYVKEEI